MITGSILMLEYDEDDQYITRQFFRENYPSIQVEIVNTSEEFFQSLTRKKENVKDLPSLMLLNYNSTPKSAPELLAEIKRDPVLRHIPAIVLSGTITPGIVEECYGCGANSFIQKPALMKDTDEKIRTFIHYWFSTVQLPKRYA
jgi:response regulator RpfG family c-di-GMP phosphodiesterase